MNAVQRKMYNSKCSHCVHNLFIFLLSSFSHGRLWRFVLSLLFIVSTWPLTACFSLPRLPQCQELHHSAYMHVYYMFSLKNKALILWNAAKTIEKRAIQACFVQNINYSEGLRSNSKGSMVASWRKKEERKKILKRKRENTEKEN